MDMQGSRKLAATQQQAWEALNDPQVLQACIPGAEKVERTGDDQYSVAVAVKIGPVSAKFAGKIHLSDLQPPQSYTLGFEGQGGAAGFGKGTAKVQLAPQDDGCELSYTVHAQVGGKIAQVGQRLIDGVARSMAEDFFQRFDTQMQQRYPSAAGAPAPVAVDEGKGGMPAWAWVAIALGAAAAAWWMLR